MNMWKKVLAVLVVVGVGAGLAIWGAGPKTIATSDEGNVTESKYYKQLKQTPVGQQTLADMVVTEVLDSEYGKNVSKKDVDKKYDETRKELGDQFEQQLAQTGMSAQTYRDSIKLDLLKREAVKANTNFSKSSLEKIYDDYQPKTSASVILLGSEDDAKKIIKELDDKDGDFSKLAKKYSGDTDSKKNGGKLDDFDSTSTKVDANVKKAVFDLENGKYSEKPVKAASNSGYYVVKRNTQEKKPSYDDMKNDLKSLRVDEIMSNEDDVNVIIGKELGKANVNIKDPDLKNALAKYTQAAASDAADKQKKNDK